MFGSRVKPLSPSRSRTDHLVANDGPASQRQRVLQTQFFQWLGLGLGQVSSNDLRIPWVLANDKNCQWAKKHGQCLGSKRYHLTWWRNMGFSRMKCLAISFRWCVLVAVWFAKQKPVEVAWRNEEATTVNCFLRPGCDGENATAWNLLEYQWIS